MLLAGLAVGALGCDDEGPIDELPDRPQRGDASDTTTDASSATADLDGRVVPPSGQDDAGPPPAAADAEASLPDAAKPAKTCGGIAALPCDEGEFCNFEDPELGLGCGFADRTGLCEPVRQLCPTLFVPVCGCDDKTYGTSCDAHAAGVSVQHGEPCETPPGVSCIWDDVRCRQAQPECPEGQVASVVRACWGPCVPIENCLCEEQSDCPLNEKYACHRFAGRCGPYVN